MTSSDLDPRIREQLQTAIARNAASGALMTVTQIAEHTAWFKEHFGPDVLGRTNGLLLLKLMHERQRPEQRCLTYSLEFKNDDEFAGNNFGRIGGGTAFKFGIYQGKSDGAWITGSPQKPRILTVEEAVRIAEQQRDELIAGTEELSRLDPHDTSDENYRTLQASMERAAPTLSGDSWAHKYWFLMYPDRLDNYHSPRFQRFHLLKLLQMPPDKTGVLDGNAGRFLCAGRYIRIAQDLEVPPTSLHTVLNERDSTIHRYWRIGTTAGGNGESQWELMREGGFVSIGWADALGDLTSLLGQQSGPAKRQIREWLLPSVENASVATRKTNEVFNFLQGAEENDLVLACEGRDVLGVGRVTGPYFYRQGLTFPHLRPVQWLLQGRWKTPEDEGLRTTVCELGRSANNLLGLERRLFEQRLQRGIEGRGDSIGSPSTPGLRSLPTMDPMHARIDNILSRKGQVILYGPPGTGKTYQALKTASELAARKAFHKTHESISDEERAQIGEANGLVRLCTFHPGFGYEDFIEGLRPSAARDGQLTFEPKPGVFKQLCVDALKRPQSNFYLIIDEINRGDLPRIFGELITSLELDKRGSAKVILPITRDVLSVPPNVFLIGTMNSADRSIALLDTAMRRRFGFVEMMPNSSVLGNREIGGIPLGPWLDAINSRLRRCLKRDARNLQIGHSFLLPAQHMASVADFGRVMRDEIVPLLQEYCYDDLSTLKDILGSDLVDVEGGRIQQELFEPNHEDSLIAALSYEEITSFTLSRESSDEGATSTNETQDDIDDNEESET